MTERYDGGVRCGAQGQGRRRTVRAGDRRATPLESWSMGKSVTASLLRRADPGGRLRLDQPAPIPEQKPGDPRSKIRIEDLLHMSSGLRCRAPQDPDFDPTGPYPDHLYLYTAPGTRSNRPRRGRSVAAEHGRTVSQYATRCWPIT